MAQPDLGSLVDIRGGQADREEAEYQKKTACVSLALAGSACIVDDASVAPRQGFSKMMTSRARRNR